jgi:sugar phosphate isomerase/epimerase
MAQNRRQFIKTTATGSAALILSSLEAFSSANKPAFTLNKSYELKIFATNWGFDGSVDAFCDKAKKAGYDGIEIGWPGDAKEQEEIFTALKKHELEVGFLCGAWESNAMEHLAHFKKMVTSAAQQKNKKPLYINCHSGRDYFSEEQNKKFIDFTVKLSKETGIRILHETHRSRILFAAHITKQFIKKNTALRLTLDISHWCNVHESLLGDQEEAVNMALERTDHIHARVGYSDGPQVNDPRAPEWEYAVKQHFAWWDKVVERKRKNGERITFLTEFGPPLYMQTLPYTLQPLSDQWAINVYMLQLLRKRYS